MLGSGNSSAIKKALVACKAVADGNFEARVIGITEKGEAGELLHAINLLIDRADAYVRESQACLEHVRDNKYYRRILEKGMTGSFLGCQPRDQQRYPGDGRQGRRTSKAWPRTLRST